MKRLLLLLALMLVPGTCAAQTTVRALGGSIEPGGVFWVVLETKPTESLKSVAGTFWVNPDRLQIESFDAGTAIIPWGNNALSEVFNQQQSAGRIGFRVQILNGNTCCGPSASYSHLLSIAVRDRGGTASPSFGFDDSIIPRAVVSGPGTIVNTSWIGATLAPIPAGTGRTLNVDSLVLIKGQVTTIPVWLRTLGGENAVSFSLLFSPLHITVETVSIGPYLPGGASITFNQAEFGRLGVIVALPPGQRFSPGDNMAALLGLRASDGFSPLMTEFMHVWFADSPIPRELVSDTAQALPFLLFQYNSLAIVPGVEGDVAPRPTGNNATSLADWVQVGRFAASLDSLSPGLEFMKADCAPRATAGDGRVTLADFVQAGRFAASLDPISYASGPSTPTGFAPDDSAFRSKIQSRSRLPEHARSVLLTPLPSRKGDLTYAVELRGEGDENAISFSLEYAGSMKLVSATTDEGDLLLNDSTPGRLGVMLAMQPGKGLSRRLLTLRFEGEGDVRFADGPVAGELVTVDARAVGVVFSQMAHQRLAREAKK